MGATHVTVFGARATPAALAPIIRTSVLRTIPVALVHVEKRLAAARVVGEACVTHAVLGTAVISWFSPK